jgi:hypothetical protein
MVLGSPLARIALQSRSSEKCISIHALDHSAMSAASPAAMAT